ncbi:MAG: hypothetical protein Kapaf2KO_08450 [Candidatus Kapaibacteriales bacterium]
MRKIYSILAISLFTISAFALPPQTTEERQYVVDILNSIYSVEDLPERYNNYRTKYEQSFDAPFEDVFNAVTNTLNEQDCRSAVSKQTQDDDGFFKGVIKSDYCVFAEGTDDLYDKLENYSLKIPKIRGGIWETGRVKYTFIIREQEDGSSNLLIKGEISGFERNITETIHFWESNGNFEAAFLDSVIQKLQ